jgi:hypothetical protein
LPGFTPWRAFDDERADPLVAERRIFRREDHVEARERRVRDPLLGAVEHVAAGAVLGRAALHPATSLPAPGSLVA